MLDGWYKCIIYNHFTCDSGYRKGETMDNYMKLNTITPKLLAQIPFFKDLENEYIEMLAGKMQVFNADKSKLIIAEGDTSQKMYFILEGTVNVFRKTYTGRAEDICELSAPNYFGEMSIIDGGPRSASVGAKTDVVLAELKWDDVRDLFEDKPEIMCYMFKNIGNTLSMRLRKVNSLYSPFVNNLKAFTSF